MLGLRPYKKCDAEYIVKWIKDEVAFRKWCADRLKTYPITAEDLNDYYEQYAFSDSFFEMTAFDETGITGHLIMRYTDCLLYTSKRVDPKTFENLVCLLQDLAEEERGTKEFRTQMQRGILTQTAVLLFSTFRMAVSYTHLFR